MSKEKYQYAIKYEVRRYKNDKYIFIPNSLVKGVETMTGFCDLDGKEYPIFIDTIAPKAKVYVDMINYVDELPLIFPELEGESEEFMGEYFFEAYKDMPFYVNMTDVNEMGIPHRYFIDINKIDIDKSTAYYYMKNSIPCVVLNEKALNEVMDARTLKQAKLLLTKYQMGMKAIKQVKKRTGITSRVSITGDKVNYYEVDKAVDTAALDKQIEKQKSISSNSGFVSNKDISYVGLRDYLRKRIYGHEKEIDTFAQKLYMNYTAVEGEPIESILLVGPTGTGKTETVKSACEYLGIPWYEINASNLISQGIVGTSIEDVIIGLYERAGKDLKKAQRGLIFLDEFDKLNDTKNETKTDVKNILLTFTAGGAFPININNYNFTFDTTMTNKIYAGVFERISEKKNPIGFGTPNIMVPSLGTAEEIREKIIDKKYLSQEELSRITTILAYNELTRETKRDILLTCTSSVYLKKRNRYGRQFDIDLVLDDGYVEALLDQQTRISTGMRCINNSFNNTMDDVEKFILENEDKGYKKLVLTKDTVNNSSRFELSA